MANDIASNVARARAIFAQLLKQVSPAEREKHLVRHGEELQAAIDRVLASIDAPVSVRRKLGRPRKVRTPVLPLAVAPAASVVEHAHDANAPCARIHEVVKAADNATHYETAWTPAPGEREDRVGRLRAQGLDVCRTCGADL